MVPILGFKGEFRFLSNFWPSIVEYEGIQYFHAEGAYQASKTNDRSVRRLISKIQNPGQAKRFWNQLEIQEYRSYSKEEWESGIGFDRMWNVVNSKFQQNEHQQESLINTGYRPIIELNNWGDQFWGMTRREDGILVGKNNLGKILETVRSNCRGEGLRF